MRFVGLPLYLCWSMLIAACFSRSSQGNVFFSRFSSRKKKATPEVLQAIPIPPDSIDSGTNDKYSNVMKVLDVLSPLLVTIGWYFNLKTLVKIILDIKTFGSNSLPRPGRLFPYLASNCTLTSFELEIADSVIIPPMINVSYDSIGGSDDIKLSLWDCVGDFIKIHRDDRVVQNPVLLSATRGALLFGPPGCGKTMLVHATGKQANLPIISISPSLLFRKYIGDTNQLLKAVFTLAQKLQPCIVFVDEMDAIFRARYESEHSIDREVKTEFMQLWDSVVDKRDAILVLGASNMPELLDPAIQRRFERSFLIGLPNKKARKKIFKILLLGSNLDSSFDFNHLASLTESYSPSDILALCKAARQIARRHNQKDGARPMNYVGNISATIDISVNSSETLQNVVYKAVAYTHTHTHTKGHNVGNDIFLYSFSFRTSRKRFKRYIQHIGAQNRMESSILVDLRL